MDAAQLLYKLSFLQVSFKILGVILYYIVNVYIGTYLQNYYGRKEKEDS